MAEENNAEWNSLLEKARAGDRTAQESLCEKIRVRLWPVLQYRLCGWPPQILEDIIQDTLVIFIEKLSIIESNPQKYVLSVLR